jgi:hypothetical protein
MESGNIVVDLHAQHPAGHPRLIHALRRASAPRAKIAHALDETTIITSTLVVTGTHAYLHHLKRRQLPG